jgi:hypothetical protein
MTRRPHSRRGFALIELPLFFLLLAGGGLLVAFLFSRFSGPAPWYAWVISAVTLPIILLTVCFVSIAAEPRLQGPPDSSRPDKPTTD